MIEKTTTETNLVIAPEFPQTPRVALEPEAPTPAPRKRGRPRKNPLPITPEQAAPPAPAAPAPPQPTPSLSFAPQPTSGMDIRLSPGYEPSQKYKADKPNAPQPEPAPDPRGESGSTPKPQAKPAPRAKSKARAKADSKGEASGEAQASQPETPQQPSEGRGKNQGQGQGQGQNQGQNQNNGDRGKNNNKNYQNYGRRPRRNYNNAREQVVPQTSREDLEGLKMAELREKAAEINLDISAIKKKEELIGAVLEAMVKAEGFISCEGILDLLPEGYGFLRTSGYLPGETDVYVGMSMVRRNGLRKGDLVTGQVRPARDNEKYAALHRIDSVNGLPQEDSRNRRRFADLTPVYPDERLLMEHGPNTITARTIDLVAPIGKGQRGLIVSPPKAGKTTILKDIAAAISANNPDVHLMCLLVDERPEEVTDMQRSIKGEVVSSTFDMPSENHIAVAELVIERAKRLVEVGRDVVILLDSITRLARAYNLAQPASGRILSGGVDSTALYPPKRFLGAARNIEDGGSLTILASALIETGSKMDEVIFEEFKGTGNMELRLDRDLADRRIFPAIDPVASGTRKEDLLLDAQEAPLIWAVRRILANMNNSERAMEMLIKSLKQTQNNAEFLMRTARKAQQRSNVEIAEL